MKLINGKVQPGINIGNFYIGKSRDEVIPLLESDYKIWNRGDGFSTYTLDNFKLWFDVDGKLSQIGVTKGFTGNYKSLQIGSTMQDVIELFGGFQNIGDEYLIPNIEGICFELEDVEDWDELNAPIEWIFVYK